MHENKTQRKTPHRLPRSVTMHRRSHLDSHILPRDKSHDHRQTQTERVS